MRIIYNNLFFLNTSNKLLQIEIIKIPFLQQKNYDIPGEEFTKNSLHWKPKPFQSTLKKILINWEISNVHESEDLIWLRCKFSLNLSVDSQQSQSNSRNLFVFNRIWQATYKI